MTDPSPEPPLAAVVQLGHAAVQRVADLAGIEVLHLKGYAIDPSLVRPGRAGTDVDVLVRPSQVSGFLRRLEDAGWQRVIGFRAGSPFGHAATLHHPCWGYVDVHRFFPGIGLDPAAAFELLWGRRQVRRIGGVDCVVPDLVGQTLVLVLNAARSGPGQRLKGDLQVAWEQATAARRVEVEALVKALDAEVAFAAATGRLEAYRDRREYWLWKVMSCGGTRLEEWRARIIAAPSRRDRLRLVLSAPLVNVEHLTVLWGRRPTRWEIAREFVLRPMRGIAEQTRAFRVGRANGR
ncbi:2-nitropropane dioxygenase [Raineyella sp. LH-20]|uniref:2-nitropropane dioxygenase n=1 Tax=Raineyella sp. LH-20 TaxID=3081204 RepID=UPI002955819E|nr:2-nitropropane dioxygenase [Raineyella sp. LH-20]WOP17199.1 2-nitropropane dioxygenase [Raineyella sp. LH-20]